MSLEEAHAQKTPWDQIDMSSGTFSHLNTTYSVENAKFEVVGELQALLDVPAENTVGVILAYKDVENPETKTEGGEEQDQTSIQFYLHLRIGNSLAVSALLDIFHNLDLNLTAIDPPAIIDDDYHYVSYVCKDGNVYELDGSKESSVLISKLSDTTDEKVNWIGPLVDYLENKVAIGCSDISCAVVKRLLDHQQEIKTGSDQTKELRKSKEDAMEQVSTISPQDDPLKEHDNEESEASVPKKPDESVATETKQSGEKEDSKSTEVKAAQQEDAVALGKRKYDDNSDEHRSSRKRNTKQDK